MTYDALGKGTTGNVHDAVRSRSATRLATVAPYAAWVSARTDLGRITQWHHEGTVNLTSTGGDMRRYRDGERVRPLPRRFTQRMRANIEVAGGRPRS
jgi:hypothetical protein